MAHQGIVMKVEGKIDLQTSGKNVGLMDALSSQSEPTTLLNLSMDVVPEGKFPHGVTELPFEFVLQPVPGQQLYETYHGVYVNITYTIDALMTRGFLAKNLEARLEFLTQIPPVPNAKNEPVPEVVPFSILPESLENVRKNKTKVPNFKISGQLDSAVCDITRPLRGFVVIEECDKAIKSIEIQLVRVETCGVAETFSKEATEVQNIQIADGDPPRNIAMIFPRMFTCPSIITKNFKVEFAVNLVIILEDGHLISEHLPLRLRRREFSWRLDA